MVNFFKKFGLVLVGLVLGLVFIECLLRLLPSGNKAGFADTDESGKLYAYDSGLGWRLKPDVKAGQKIQDFSVEYRTNSEGFRDDKTFGPKKAWGKTRVLVFGDSFAFGVGVPLEKTFTKQLEGGYSGKYEALDFGVSGYDPGQYLLAAKKEAAKYRPDVVVFALYLGNDIEDLPLSHLSQGTRYFKPYFELDGGKLVLKNVPVPEGSPSSTAATDVRIKTSWFSGAAGWLSGLRTAALFKNILKDPLYPVLAKLGLVKDIQDYKPNLDLLQAVLTDAERTFGVGHFAVLIIPSINGSHSYLEKKFASSVDSALTARKIPFYDLMPDISASKQSYYYFPHEGHFNEAGHALAAGKLAKLLDELANRK